MGAVAVVCRAGRSRGAWIHGTAVGSCTEEKRICIILPDWLQWWPCVI